MTDERPCRECGNIDLDGRAHVYGERKCCPDCDHRVPQLSLSERIVVAHFENGEAAPESYGFEPCTSYSHGEDGWHCVLQGEHDRHLNATGNVTWRQVGTLGVWTHDMGDE